MMYVMNTNIGGEPAQDARQVIIRATVKRYFVQVPKAVRSPFGILELVLDIEQPDTDRSRQQNDWQLHEQERKDAHQPYHGGYDSRDGDVGGHDAEPGLPTSTHETDWQPVLNDEQKCRAQTEHGDRVSINAITKPTPSGQRVVLVHC
jgi:hypothetical protein